MEVSILLNTVIFGYGAYQIAVDVNDPHPELDQSLVQQARKIMALEDAKPF